MLNGKVFGIDVSNNNGIINWSATPDYIDFVFIKASEGNYYKDIHVKRNAEGARSRGYKVGFYHFLQPSIVKDAQLEAYTFMDVITTLDLQVGEMLVCDIEQGEGDLHSYNLFFMQLVEMMAGFKPIEYSRTNFINEHGLNTPEMAQHPLWIAQYPSSGSPTINPIVPSAWETYSFWQYSEKGRISGTESNVDLNIFNGSLERLPLLGKPAPISEPETINKLYVLEKLSIMEAQVNIIQDNATNLQNEIQQLKNDLDN